MKIANRNFPRWAGPALGIVAGFGCGLAAYSQNKLFGVWLIMYGPVLGFIAGCLMLLLDRPMSQVHAGKGSSVVQRVLAVSALLLFFHPILGLILGVVALILNRNAADWARPVSSLALALTVLTHIVFLIWFVWQAAGPHP